MLNEAPREDDPFDGEVMRSVVAGLSEMIDEGLPRPDRHVDGDGRRESRVEKQTKRKEW